MELTEAQYRHIERYLPSHIKGVGSRCLGKKIGPHKHPAATTPSSSFSSMPFFRAVTGLPYKLTGSLPPVV